ncbi:MAG: hypothetical protein HUU16_18970 [Candidatus Omnitrophica bacterium]|nr:hypothetical protein [Candidatus Omnitrophota bacterium]
MKVVPKLALVGFLVTTLVAVWTLAAPQPAQAGDWSFSIGPGYIGVGHGHGHHGHGYYGHVGYHGYYGRPYAYRHRAYSYGYRPYPVYPYPVYGPYYGPVCW